jgi:cold shock CspA family protein
MGRSQETYGKKEVRKRKEQKRKEKEQKKARKKIEGRKDSFDDMIAYVDEFGMITSTPPDPEKRSVVEAGSIELDIARKNSQNDAEILHKGVVTAFNELKRYGFIRDLESRESYFLHANSLEEPVKENDIVVFKVGKGIKGPAALNVKLFRE